MADGHLFVSRPLNHNSETHYYQCLHLLTSKSHTFFILMPAPLVLELCSNHHQKQEGKNEVIAYATRRLSHSESCYPAHKLEFLALKWSVTEKFSNNLYGCHFTVVTATLLLFF